MLSLHHKVMSHLGRVSNRVCLCITADFVGFGHKTLCLSHFLESLSVQLFFRWEQFLALEHWSPLFALSIQLHAFGDEGWGPGQGTLHQTRTRGI